MLYSDPDSALLITKGMLNSKPELYNGRILNTLGAAYLVKGALDSSLFYYTYDTVSRKPLDLANAYGGIGGVLSAKRLNQDALTYYQKAADLYQELDHQQFLAGAYNNIANILTRIKDYVRAKSYYREAINIHLITNDSSRLLPNFFNMGDLYRIVGDYDSAIHYAQQTLIISTRLNSLYGQAKATGLMATIYNEIEKPDNALQSAIQGKELMLVLGDSASYREILIQEAIALSKLGRVRQSDKIAFNLLGDTIHYSANLKPEIYGILYKNAKSVGDFEKAFNYRELQLKEENEISNLALNETINELQAKYELNKRQEEIKELEQQAALAKVESQRENAIWLATVVVLILLLIVIFFWYQRRVAQQKTKALHTNLKFLQSQLNPHFVYNSLTSLQRFVIENKSDDATLYISKFSRLMRQFLEHSREDYISIGEEVNAIENYLLLQKIRYKEKFRYTVKLNNPTHKEVFIPQTLQEQVQEVL